MQKEGTGNQKAYKVMRTVEERFQIMNIQLE
jgi:hypothetical protein